jgi:two-component system sensor histidine kinase/response regulator
MRMLVVDDTLANRMILEDALTARGASVTCVDSGRAALDELDRAAACGESYRAMLLDCRMPEMDGIEVAARIRDGALAPHDRPIILMLTSDDLGETMARARAVGIETYMIKPIKRAELYEALDRALGISSAAPQPASSTGSNQVASIPVGDVFNEPRPLKILLADDSRDNRLLVKAYFKKLPYTLHEAENGAIAVEMFKAGSYDLVLMDIEMPIMDGYTATRAMRAIEKDVGGRRIPILALTASVLAEALSKALDAGCDMHIAKPVKKETLLVAVQTAISEAEASNPSR